MRNFISILIIVFVLKCDNKTVNNVRRRTQSKTQHNTKRTNTNPNLEKDENDNGNGNTIKIQVESSCEPKQEKNLPKSISEKEVETLLNSINGSSNAG